MPAAPASRDEHDLPVRQVSRGEVIEGPVSELSQPRAVGGHLVQVKTAIPLSPEAFRRSRVGLAVGEQHSVAIVGNLGVLVAALRQLAGGELSALHRFTGSVEDEDAAARPGIPARILRELMAKAPRRLLDERQRTKLGQRVGKGNVSPHAVRASPERLPIKVGCFFEGRQLLPLPPQRLPASRVFAKLYAGGLQVADQAVAPAECLFGGCRVGACRPLGADSILHPPVPLDQRLFDGLSQRRQHGGCTWPILDGRNRDGNLDETLPCLHTNVSPADGCLRGPASHPQTQREARAVCLAAELELQ